MISDNELIILIQSYEAIGSSRSINQNWVLDSLKEVQRYRKSADGLIGYLKEKFGNDVTKEILERYNVPR